MCCCDFKISCDCILKCLENIGCIASGITLAICIYKLIKLFSELAYKIYENKVRERIEKEKLKSQKDIIENNKPVIPNTEGKLTDIQKEYLASLKYMIEQSTYENDKYKNELLKYINDNLK